MKIKYLLFSALLILAVFSRDTLAAVNNASYKVKITILTPSDQVDLYDQWNNQPAKNLVLDAVKQVKDLYSQQLNGSTFMIDENVAVIKSVSSLPPGSAENDLTRIFEQLLGYNYISDADNVANLVFVVGRDTNGIQWGGRDVYGPHGSIKGLEGFTWAILDGRRLLDVTYNANSDQYYAGLQAIAHELGHAFGLNYSGYTNGHVCSESVTTECNDEFKKLVDSKKAVYPPRSESEYDVMNPYRYIGDLSPRFKNLQFANNWVNSEKYQLCQSPFIQPKCNLPPDKEAHRYTTFSETNLYQIVPGKIDVSKEDTFRLTGKFDTQRGSLAPTVKIWRGSQILSPDIDYQIVNFSQKDIEIKILNKEALGYWNFTVTDADQNWIRYTESLLVIDGAPGSVSATSKTVKFKVKATCDGAVGIVASLKITTKINGESRDLDSSFLTDSSGNAQIAFTVEPQTQEDNFTVTINTYRDVSVFSGNSRTFNFSNYPDYIQFDAMCSSQPSVRVVTVNKCGNNQIPGSFDVSIIHKKADGTSDLRNYSNRMPPDSRQTGRVFFDMVYPDFQEGDSYVLQANNIRGYEPKQKEYLIMDSYPQESITKTFEIYYPVCPVNDPRVGLSSSVDGDILDTSGKPVPFYSLKARTSLEDEDIEESRISLDELKSRINDPKTKAIIDLTRRQLYENSSDIEACVEDYR